MGGTPLVGRDTAMAAPTRVPVTGQDLHGFTDRRLLGPRWAPLHAAGPARDRAGNRPWFYDQDATVRLWYFLSPLLIRRRGLQPAPTWAKGQGRFGIRPPALGALREAAPGCAAALRHAVIEALGRRLPPPAVATERAALQARTAVDGRLLPARPKLAWALGQGAQHRAAKMPGAFAGRRQIPVGVTVTAGQASERAAWRRLVPPGGLDVVDRGSADDERFQAWHDLPCRFLARVPDHAADEVHDERPGAAAAQAAGVRRDGLIRRLGTAHHTRLLPPPCRVGLVASGQTKAAGPPALLVRVTHPRALDAEWVAVAYRWRWAVARFCRGLKGVLGCRHWRSQSAHGVRLQVYVALIASRLICRWGGRPPTKRTYEMRCFDLSGWASEAEVIAPIDRWHFLSPPTSKK
jgi:Transposase DDE domain